jgi:predicted DNA-binding transcriptional regulator YafY
VPDAVERLVNLALYLAQARVPVSAERIRVDVAGYPSGQDTEAFLRMFERDKDVLRDAGFSIVADESGSYLVDSAATFASSIEISAEETAAIRVAVFALFDDPSYPFSSDLRLALAKITSAVDGDRVTSVARLADEAPPAQGHSVALLADAAQRRKHVTFGYTDSRGASGIREIEPYGLFLHDGRWYAVGLDSSREAVRTFTISRMSDIQVNAARPKSADFERPVDFDVANYSRLPFQFGSPADEFEALLRFEPTVAWRAVTLAGDRGSIERVADGTALWRVAVRDKARLTRFVVEHGPGLSLVEPAEIADSLRSGLEEVARSHG